MMRLSLEHLAPSFPTERLYPTDAAYMARTDLRQTRMLGYSPYNLDAVTTLLLGLLGKRPAVRHRSGATGRILAFMEYAGLRIEEDLRVYQDADEAERHADALIDEGYRLIWPYPLPTGRYPAAAHLTPIDAWHRLNAKQYLDRLVPPDHLAPRRLMSLEAFAAESFTRPIFVKAGGNLATGWGYAVRYCENRAALEEAFRWFRAAGDVREVIAEDALAVQTCWCANICVEDEQTTYLGAAEQLFESPAHQSGSLIDPANALPAEGVELAVGAGEVARGEGFRGIAALDIGMTDDGRLIVFDPNFRVNACTTQVLLHDAAAKRSGLCVSHSADGETCLPAGELIDRLSSQVEKGWFIPTRLLDGSLLPAAEGRSRYTGFVMGATREQASRRAAELRLTVR